jgi:acyl-coenzyme A synthetase/AMP-(fatty) acid ligase
MIYNISSIRFVDRIPRTKSGKYSFLTQKLLMPIEYGD